jgi:hypothetical protein
VVDARGVGRQIGTFRHDVDSGEHSDGLIHHQIHNVAFTLRADQFQGQQAGDGLRGGNHFRTR